MLRLGHDPRLDEEEVFSSAAGQWIQAALIVHQGEGDFDGCFSCRGDQGRVSSWPGGHHAAASPSAHAHFLENSCFFRGLLESSLSLVSPVLSTDPPA